MKISTYNLIRNMLELIEYHEEESDHCDKCCNYNPNNSENDVTYWHKDNCPVVKLINHARNILKEQDDKNEYYLS